MQKTTEILKDVETLLIQAELRVTLIGDNEVLDVIEDVKKSLTSMNTIHSLTTKLENALLKKINYILDKRVEELSGVVNS